jgi:anti-sigma regulatory factor (Ser/Thr protein kinase)
MTLANSVASLEAARLALLDFLAVHALSPRSLFNLELVLEETLMNRVWHAHPQAGAHLIELTAQVRPEEVVLSFTDDGVPFDPLQHTAAKRPTSLADAVPGGLGLMLTRKRVSQARYERVDGKNLLTLHVARTG